jgi:hypothetical protein
MLNASVSKIDLLVESDFSILHPDRYTLAHKSYRKDLWNCLEPVLDVYGFGQDELLKLRNSLVDTK